MAWFKVDDTLHSHPKMRKCGLPAAGIWVLAGSYCMAYKTDGFVPGWWINQLGSTARRAAKILVEVGLWEEAVSDSEKGYRFHDWTDYQPSVTEIERDRENARNRQRRLREERRSAQKEVS